MVMVVVVILSFFFSIMHDLMSALGHIYNLVGALLFWLKINNLLLKSWEIKVMDDHRGDLLSWNLRVSSKLYKFQLDPVVNLFICFS